MICWPLFHIYLQRKTRLSCNFLANCNLPNYTLRFKILLLNSRDSDKYQSFSTLRKIQYLLRMSAREFINFRYDSKWRPNSQNSHVRCCFQNGDSSPFLIDNRLYFYRDWHLYGYWILIYLWLCFDVFMVLVFL